MVRLAYAIRSLAKSPLLSLTVVFSLALGIGANTAIFSLLRQVILSSLPVAHPEELALPTSNADLKDGRVSSNNSGHSDYVFSYPAFRALELHPAGLAGIAAFRTLGANLAFGAQTVHGKAVVVSGRYFSLLGVRPEIGRVITPQDDISGAGNPVAVLSYSYWSGPLGGQLDVINQPLRVNGHVFTVVGVAPRGFNGITLGDQPNVFLPLSFKPLLTPGWNGTDHYDDYWLYLIARRRPGYSLKQSEDSLNGVYRGLMEQQVAVLHYNGKVAERLVASKISLQDGAQGNSDLRDQARTPILILTAATIMVLLIAMANAANLLLARSAQRRKELAIRAAIGAGRGELMTQLLTEAMLLSFVGALAGFAIALVTLRFLVSHMGDGGEPVTFLTTGLDWSVLLYGIGVAFVTGLACGLYPAWDAARTSAAATLKDAAGQASGRGVSRVRRGLVCAQVMVSAALLIPTGLFLKSLVNLMSIDLGLKSDRVVTFTISPEMNGYSFDACRALFARAESELAAIPGVTGVTDAMVTLIAGDNWGNSLTIPGLKLPNMNAFVNEVGPGFFARMGVPVIAGREFTESDNLAGQRVAVVNREFVNHFFPNASPLGRQFRVGEDPALTIVGVAQNSHYSAVKEEAKAVYYTPWRQDKQLGDLTFYVRSALPEDQTMVQARRVIHSIDANLPLEGLGTFDAQIAQSTRSERLILQLSGAFAILATGLAMLGLYGVMAFNVARRTREIGIRLALGAKPAAIRRMVIREMLWILGIGLAFGVPAALALGRLTESQLYGVKAFDALVLASACGVLCITALAAAFLPANRAAGVSPTQALRYE